MYEKNLINKKKRRKRKEREENLVNPDERNKRKKMLKCGFLLVLLVNFIYLYSSSFSYNPIVG
jgi:hypothetical protein